jgi:hypothetical protein
MPENPTKRYLVAIQFGPRTPVTELARRVPDIRDHIDKFSNGEMEQFFRSPEGHVFGLLFRSAKPLPVMRSILDGATNNADAVMILELGDNFDAKNFGRAFTWLQHH